MTLSLDGAAVFHSAVDIRVQQSFVASVDDGLNIRGITIRNFEGFSVEYFAVGVVGATVLIYEFDEFGTILVLTDWQNGVGVVVGEFCLLFCLLLTVVGLYWMV